MAEVQVKLAGLRLMLDQVRAMAQPKRVIQTQAEADEINARERPYGLTYEWRVGDRYYLLSDLRG